MRWRRCWCWRSRRRWRWPGGWDCGRGAAERRHDPAGERRYAADMRRLAALLLLLALAGCAERWTRPGATEAQADAANAACTDQAMLAVPPQMSWEIVEPGGT